jgi:hypothetical protein
MGDPSGMLRKTIKNTKLNYSKMNNNLLKIFKQWRSSGN